MTEQEFVELLLSSGINGKTGHLEAQECVYDYDTASLIPFMTDQWQGVHLPGGISYGINWIYGDNTSPYFLCNPGKEGSGGSVLDMAGFSVGVVLSEQQHEIGGVIVTSDALQIKFVAFDSTGNVIGMYDGGSFDTIDEAGLILDEIYLTPMAGYNDNNDSYFYQFAFGLKKLVGEEEKNYSRGGTSLIAGNSLTYWGIQWAEGQEPIEDDGVTPTGGSGGGGGYYNRYDETIGIPGLPSINLASLGLCSIYHVTEQQCSDFSAYLWSPGGFFDDIIKNQASPMENIISLSIVPSFNFNEGGAHILIGNTDSGVNGYKLNTTYYEIDCGTINVTEYYKNFADYRTELQIYLPFIGIRDININDCMSGKIKVVYHCDVFSGQCVAFIQTQVGNGAWHVVASYNGSIACQVPLSGANYMGVFNGVLGAIGSAFSGNIIGATSSLMNATPTYQRSGNIGSTAGLMGIRYPYLIFTTPQLFTAETFKQNKGYMSNLSGKLSSFSGFVSCDPDKLDLTGLNLMDEEMEMLYSILSEGIYI